MALGLSTFCNKNKRRFSWTFGDRVLSSAIKKLIRSREPRHEEPPAISRIPLEILSDIFLICSSESDAYPKPKTLAIEVTLSHVSRKWRVAALITPRLWSRQTIKWNTSPDQVNQYLARSKLALLEVHLLFDMLSGRCRSFPSSLLIVCRAAERWGSLSVRIIEFDIWGRFTSCFPRSFPSLKTLSVYFHEGYSIWGPFNPYNAFADGAPILSSISITNICRTFSLPPLASVTHFIIGRDSLPPVIHFDSLIPIIEGFPNLLYLGIHSNICCDAFTSTSFTLPSLQTLAIVNARSPSILLSNIVAPALNHVILKGVEIFSFRRTLLADHQPTFPSVTSLSMVADSAFGTYALRDWIQVVYVFPAITHLELVETDYHPIHEGKTWFKWKPVLDALTMLGGPTVVAGELPDQSSFWPNLTSISYQGRATFKMFIDLLTARAQMKLPIQLLSVSRDLHSQFTNNDTWQHLQKLVQMEVFKPEEIL